MTPLGDFDGYRIAWLPADPIPAQRNYSAAHGNEGIYANGAFHTAWAQGSSS